MLRHIPGQRLPGISQVVVASDPFSWAVEDGASKSNAYQEELPPFKPRVAMVDESPDASASFLFFFRTSYVLWS